MRRSTDRIVSPKGKDRRTAERRQDGRGDSPRRAGRDRRVFNRANRVLPVWYRYEGQFRKGCALDLSAGGAALITEVDFKPGDTFEFTIQVEVDWEIKAVAEVLWSESAPDGLTHMLGVKFRPERKGDKNLLGPWVQRNMPRKPRPEEPAPSPKRPVRVPPPDVW